MSHHPGAGPLVIKLGGSLLDWTGLPSRLGSFLAECREEYPVILVGGGPAADFIRALDRLHGLGESTSHALALRSLDLTAHALACLVPGLEVVDRLDRIGEVQASGRVPVFAPRLLLDEEDRSHADPLPHVWSVTSDAISARVAVRLGASGLVLLKSAPPPDPASRAEAARLGLVDPAFARESEPLERVTYLNLRDERARPVLLGR